MENYLSQWDAGYHILTCYTKSRGSGGGMMFTILYTGLVVRGFGIGSYLLVDANGGRVPAIPLSIM